ncbi:hypothetical protein [Deinococcus sp. Arct2-2]|uniref:hypothetical protein n=1 Tax=Deinococcus sp. Arct2-2 TaxID=2568653 RepID=UPI001454D4F9|nr:hypothetical protein [Deinococcus sp. Arct2-2]
MHSRQGTNAEGTGAGYSDVVRALPREGFVKALSWAGVVTTFQGRARVNHA